ncbi:MAG: hypothetical protein MJ172_03265 [Clostridia bacterium]|nr:hypothetical protein [Clostridia bacterium]
MILGYLLASTLGLLLGFGVALFVTANILLKSNNIGDSKGTIFDFSKEGIDMLYSEDRIKERTFIPSVDATPTTEQAIREEQKKIRDNQMRIESTNGGISKEV